MKEKAGQSTIKETFALNRQFAGAFSGFFLNKRPRTIEGLKCKESEIRGMKGITQAATRRWGKASEGRQKTTGGTTNRLLVPAIQLSSYTAFCFQSQP